MNRNGRRALISGLIVFKVVIIIFFVNQGFNRDTSSGARDLNKNSRYQVGAFKLPDTLDFAGERLPMEFFDTRESLDRELLISAYRHSSTITLIKRSNRYFPVIESILDEYGLPDDFKYLAVAESDLSNAVSPVGATGFWQIMKGTGTDYGMEINQEVDERYHLEKSTRVACMYLLKAYEKYGSWTLAAAAYNGGNRGVDEQISIQEENNYYDLLLNEETARYVFRIVSYKLIFTNPSDYGINIDNSDLYPVIPYEVVKIDSAVTSFAQFAKSFNTNYKILKYFNPWLRKPFLTNRTGREYYIRIPAGDARKTKMAEES